MKKWIQKNVTLTQFVNNLYKHIFFIKINIYNMLNLLIHTFIFDLFILEFIFLN